MSALRYEKGHIAKRIEIGDRLQILRIRPLHPVAFTPGQYITLGLYEGDRVVERPYSVVSHPGEPELEFFVENVVGGRLSPFLCGLREGGEVYLRPSAKGRFGFDRESGHRNHFLVATGTGIAPYVSMAREFAGSPAPPQYRLAVLHGARISGELGYGEEFARYAEHDWMHYIPTISRSALDAAWTGERGRVEDVARKHLDTLGFAPGHTTSYLCGNPEMIRVLRGILERAGFPAESIREERYWPGEREPATPAARAAELEDTPTGP